jgi:thymidine kinase
MGSSKTANAIMVQYNYRERNQKVLMVKPQLEDRDGARIIRSRSGLETECVFAEELETMDLTGYDCVIVDEAQFLTKAQVEYLVHIVDDLGIPVIAYGLRADFKGNFFEGSMWLMAWADTIEEVKTICWCGKKAICNARVVDGKVAREGEQIVLGGDEQYVSLCRKHWRAGDLGKFKGLSFHD